MLFRHFCVQAFLLAMRSAPALGAAGESLGRCQKSGCRPSSPEGPLRGSTFRAARETPSRKERVRALACEWFAVFAIVQVLLYVKHLPRRLSAMALTTARSFDQNCTALLHRAAAGSPPSRIRRRPASSRGTCASLESSLADLVGSDAESALPSSAASSSSASSTSVSAYSSATPYSSSPTYSRSTKSERSATIAASNHASACTEPVSNATTVPRSNRRAAARAAARKRAPRDDTRSAPSWSSSSSSSTGALASTGVPAAAVPRKKIPRAAYDSPYYESDSSSGCDTNDSPDDASYFSSDSIVSRMLDYLTDKAAPEAAAGGGPGGASARPLRYGGRPRQVKLDAFLHGHGMKFQYAVDVKARGPGSRT